MIVGLLLIGMVGGFASAFAALWLGFGWILALLAYSLGGAVAMLLPLIPVALSLRPEERERRARLHPQRG